VKRSFLAVLLTALPLASAWAESPLQPVSARLYGQRGYQEGGGCDVGTHLVLDRGQLFGDFAYLENFVNGVCDLYVPPEARTYRLSTGRDGCGSLVYTGSIPGTQRTVEIVDNRTRICDDVIPALLVVIEREGDEVRQLYSVDSSLSP
jgi:hypothetical protein